MKKMFIVVLFITISSLYFAGSLTYGKFRISFLDVGQGDAIFIRTPDDYTVLVDGGPSSKVLEQIAEVMPVYSRTIDILILTHPHSDHVNGLTEITKRYVVKKAFITGVDYYNPYYTKLLSLFNEKKIPVYFAKADNDFKIGKNVYLDFVWPSVPIAGRKFENVNNSSIALRVIYKDKIIFLGGDAEQEQENEMINSGFNLSADILKAGHHGSRTATQDEFLDKVDPRIVVIQSGTGNSYKHPHKEILEKLFDRNIEIRRNDKEGRIDFIF
ncbi:MBL fold metallo-hydrolase [Candidatus Peregrinibacteria bacterium]|nr:MBL fold metallo-hydrolase [Candidatus Peregrinibacteria bacterium]